MNRDLLAPEVYVESPSSSVFDLSVQPVSLTPDTVHSGRNGSGDRLYSATHIEHDATGHISSRTRSSISYLLVSGGTGGNSICAAFDNACYVLPVSDDGGSSSEIIRVLGGPSIGDIRSRLVRLIPPAPPSSPLDAIRKLMSYRLPVDVTEREARDEWRDIVEGTSSLWSGIPNDRKETIRGFLVYFEAEVLKRAHKRFSFINGSIGNYFLAGAMGFLRSLPSAIFLFSSITSSQANILPVIVTNHTVTIAAELENGSKLVGQCEISHPVGHSTPESFEQIQNSGEDDDDSSLDGISEDGMGEVLPQRQNVKFSQQEKDTVIPPLTSRISKLHYINTYGSEIHPAPNPEYLRNISASNVLVYACGSLWTSIIPCLALRGVGPAIARSNSLRAKILLLNSENDRETPGYTAVDYIRAFASTLNAQYQKPPYGLGNANTTYPVSAFITHMVYLERTHVDVDVIAVTALGVKCIKISGSNNSPGKPPRFDAKSARKGVELALSQLN